MPIFDYACPQCGNMWEEITKHTSEDPLIKFPCSDCGAEGERKISTSGVSFRLYGEGFYKRTHRDTGDFS